MNNKAEYQQRISKRITMYGMLIAVGAAIYILESYAPFPVPIPGARWGFSNMIIVYALPDTPLSWLIVLTMGKSFIGSLLGGTFLAPTFLMGFTGSIASTIAMYLSFRTVRKAGLIFHSIMGAIFNNIIQVLVAVQVVGTWAIISYLPYMEIIGIFSGIANAIIAGVLVKRINSEK